MYLCPASVSDHVRDLWWCSQLRPHGKPGGRKGVEQPEGSIARPRGEQGWVSKNFAHGGGASATDQLQALILDIMRPNFSSKSAQ